MQRVVAFDTETFRIGPGCVLPKVVCLSLATRTSDGVVSIIYGNADDIEGAFLSLLNDPNIQLRAHNAGFDLGVLMGSYPGLITPIFQALESNRIACTVIQEKLLNVSDAGKLRKCVNPDGSESPIEYSLLSCMSSYGMLGEDDLRKSLADKTAEDSWRLNYSILDGVKAKDYPEGAVAYASQDARWVILLDEAQEYRAKERHLSMAPRYSVTADDVALKIETAIGIAVDQNRVEEVKAKLAIELDTENIQLLLDYGILRPAIAPKPKRDGTLTKGKASSICKERLSDRIRQICEEHGVPLKMTAPSERFPEGQVASDGEFIEELAQYDLVLWQYEHRQQQQKVVQEIAKLDGAKRVHANYDALKETIRTSSYGNPKGKPALYPSVNIQQQDNRVRGIYVPDDGWIMGSADFSSLELVGLAQTCYTLFGYSQLAELLLAGVDPHMFLGAQLAYATHEQFRAYCGFQDKMGIYRRMVEIRDTQVGGKEFAAHYRTFAKPVGLGYPGGLGAKRLVVFARSTYGVNITEQQASDFKKLWLETYPEMELYFRYINEQCQDFRNEDAYRYTTPRGFVRSGASYCAACNGLALQSPSAEGAKLANRRVVRACVDPSVGSILYGSRPLAFIHDEILFEVLDDEKKSEKAFEVGRIMVESLAQVMPDLAPAIRASPCLMRRWDKRAKQITDPDGRLLVWEPSKEHEK